MLQVLVGVIVRYDAAAGLATIRLRQPLENGDLLRIVGGRTNKELKFDGGGPSSSGVARDFEAVVHGVEAGDMVLRVVTPSIARAMAA